MTKAIGLLKSSMLVCCLNMQQCIAKAQDPKELLDSTDYLLNQNMLQLISPFAPNCVITSLTKQSLFLSSYTGDSQAMKTPAESYEKVKRLVRNLSPAELEIIGEFASAELREQEERRMKRALRKKEREEEERKRKEEEERQQRAQQLYETFLAPVPYILQGIALTATHQSKVQAYKAMSAFLPKVSVKTGHLILKLCIAHGSK